MNALLKTAMGTNNDRLTGWAGEAPRAARVVALSDYVTVAHEPKEIAAAGSRYEAVKHFALLVAAPLIGLGFVLAFPFIGLGTIAWMGARALLRHSVPKKVAVFLKNVVLFFAAPFIGLAYALAFPLIGVAMLAAAASRALAKRSGPA